MPGMVRSRHGSLPAFVFIKLLLKVADLLIHPVVVRSSRNSTQPFRFSGLAHARIFAGPVQNRTAKALLLGYVLLFLWAAISPYDRATWWAENIPIVSIAAVLVLLYLRGFVFSAAAYAMMAVLLYLHTIGGHYTFERVPFGFVTNLFGFHRNHYDRMAHFSVGFYAFAIAEALVRTKAIRSRLVLFLFPIFTIAFVAMGYELIEWWYAASAGGASGAAFLGSQGDIWDAQKDMLADTLGAILATAVFFLCGRAAKAR